MKILIVVAMAKEADPIIKKLDMRLSNTQLSENFRAPIYFKTYAQHELYLLLSGKDKLHNTDLLGSGIIPSVTLALHIIKPDLIINIGSAGGFSQRGAKKHEIYLSDGTFRFHDRLFGPDIYHKSYGIGSYPVFDGVDELANNLSLKKANISTGGSMLSSKEEAEQMKKNGAVLKEMEAAHVAQVASLFTVPMLAIKGVSDLVDTADCPQEQFVENIHSLSEKLAEVLCRVLKALPQKPPLKSDSDSDVHQSEMGSVLVKYFDATAEITEDTIIFPGDPPFKRETVQSINEHCCFQLSRISLNNHMGTHIDFPSHIIRDGKCSSDYSIEDLIGSGIVIEFISDQAGIDSQFIRTLPILNNDFVFFKTRNSKLSKKGPLSENYVYITPDGAAALLEKKVRVVGIDYISVDSLSAEKLPVHHLLLSNNILIVENLNLNNVPAGRCHITIAPIHIPNMDGLPARVLIRK